MSKADGRGHHPRCPVAGRVHRAVLGAGKAGTQDERCGSGPRTPRAAPRTLPPSKTPSPGNVGSRRSRSWRRLPLPGSQKSPPRRRGRLRPTSSLPPSPFPAFPLAARPLLPPPSIPHPVCGPLPLRPAERLDRPRPDREAGAQAAAATRGCGGERDPRPRGGPASGPGTRGLPLHPSPRARPRGGVEEVRTSRGRTAGPLLDRAGGEDPSRCLLLLFLLPRSPLEARRLPDPTRRDSGQATPEAKEGLI